MKIQDRNNIIGTIFAEKYKIIRLLGEGGMGSVYLAENIYINKKVALKLLKPELTVKEEIVKRFIQEAKAASQIGHPNIIDIYDIGVFNGIYYIVMELLTGKELIEVMQEEGKLSIDKTIHIMLQLLSALKAAHEKGIIHRDIKPENIFLVDMGIIKDFVKLLDFGVAKLTGAKGRLTSPDTTFGTPYYMSPEQATGVKDIDGRADLFSAGVMMYEMLCGQLPYQTESISEYFAQFFGRAPFPPPSSLNPEIDNRLEKIILKAMEFDIKNRYQSAEEFMNDLKEYQESRTGFLEKIDTEEEVAANLESTNEEIMEVKGGGIHVNETVKEEDVEKLNISEVLFEEEEKKKRKNYLIIGGLPILGVLLLVGFGIFLFTSKKTKGGVEEIKRDTLLMEVTKERVNSNIGANKKVLDLSTKHFNNTSIMEEKLQNNDNPHIVKLKLNLRPKDAIVYLNGEKLFEREITFEVKEPVTYYLVVKRDKFKPQEINLKLDKNSPEYIEKEIILLPLAGYSKEAKPQGVRTTKFLSTSPKSKSQTTEEKRKLLDVSPW